MLHATDHTDPRNAKSSAKNHRNVHRDDQELVIVGLTWIMMLQLSFIARMIEVMQLLPL